MLAKPRPLAAWAGGGGGAVRVWVVNRMGVGTVAKLDRTSRPTTDGKVDENLVEGP
jgi:hypothetical protein